MSNSKKEAVKGLADAGIILLAVCWLGLVFAGMAIVFSPNRHSPIVGWTLLVVAAVVLVAAMDRWVKAFPGLLVLATLNSLIMLYTGHSLNDSLVRVSRQWTVVFTLSMAASAFITLRFRTNKLNAIDRVALLIFVGLIFYQAVVPSFQPFAGPIGFGSLFVAWAYDRVRQRGRGPSASLSAPDA